MWDIVLATDLSTGLTEEVAGGFVGRGTIFVQASDIVLDKKNNRLLIADAEQDAVIAMDLDSRERTLLSRNGTRGFGPPLTGVSSLAIDSDNGVLYAGSPELEGLLAVDLETGQRDVALSTCTDVSGRVRPARFERMTDMILADGKILISGSTLSTFDIESGSCTQGTTPRTSLYSIGSVKGSDSLLYGISQFYDALVLLDKVSGSVVLISD